MLWRGCVAFLLSSFLIETMTFRIFEMVQLLSLKDMLSLKHKKLNEQISVHSPFHNIFEPNLNTGKEKHIKHSYLYIYSMLKMTCLQYYLILLQCLQVVYSFYSNFILCMTRTTLV